MGVRSIVMSAARVANWYGVNRSLSSERWQEIEKLGVVASCRGVLDAAVWIVWPAAHSGRGCDRGGGKGKL